MGYFQNKDGKMKAMGRKAEVPYFDPNSVSKIA